MKKTITKEFQFDSAHNLRDGDLDEKQNRMVFGKCYNTHGHRYKLFVTVSGEEKHGMVVNFTELKRIVNLKVIDTLDHENLNHHIASPTTCENMIEWIWDKLFDILEKSNITLNKLKLYETPTSYCTLEK